MHITPALPRIYQILGEAVVLDIDLAAIYGVPTNRAIERKARFPRKFAFRVPPEDFDRLRREIGTSSPFGGHRYRPWVFSEHGALMAAKLPNSDRAISLRVYVVRAFVSMRRGLLANTELEAQLNQIEQTLVLHSTALGELFFQLRPLLLPPPDPSKPRTGFHPEGSAT